MTVKQLIEKLMRLPQDYEVVLYQSCGVWDASISQVHIHHSDKKRNIKKVTIT